MSAAIAMTWPDYQASQVRIAGEAVKLTPQETELVSTLLIRRGAAIARGSLIEAIWPNPDLEPDTAANILAVITDRVRKKIGRIFIETMSGRGLRIPHEHELAGVSA